MLINLKKLIYLIKGLKMKIALSGAQSTGKSTLIRALKEDPLFSDFEVFSNITRQLSQSGYKINELGEDKTQLEMMRIHSENASVLGSAIYDRCVIDPYVYTLYLYRQGQVDKKTLNYAYNKMKENYKKYDIIFYIKPEFDIVEDGVRATDITFRDEILKIFEEVLKEENIKTISLSGSIQERKDAVITHYSLSALISLIACMQTPNTIREAIQ